MSRIGLGRHGQPAPTAEPLVSDAGDPLDGLVNLFDVGLVLAVAFLIAGLSLQVNKDTGKVEKGQQQRTLTTPQSEAKASGQGQPVGQVYRLPDGRLVLVDK